MPTTPSITGERKSLEKKQDHNGTTETVVERDRVPAITVTTRLHEIRHGLKRDEFARVPATDHAITLS